MKEVPQAYLSSPYAGQGKTYYCVRVARGQSVVLPWRRESIRKVANKAVNFNDSVAHLVYLLWKLEIVKADR